MNWTDLVQPATLRERAQLKRKGRNSRPGKSGWKAAFLDFFPEWAQEAYWESLDVQRACAVVAGSCKQALQINLAKPTGGYRPSRCWRKTSKPLKDS